MDPYSILNVKRTDSKEAITKAYRKLARQWHPDKNHNSKESEDKFKNISLAYEMINNPGRFNKFNMNAFNEEQYDRMANNLFSKTSNLSSWFTKVKNMDFNNLTSNFFNEACKYKNFYNDVTNKNDKNKPKTDDIIINITVSLQDIFNNIKKTINITRTRKCSKCLGLGFTINGECSDCLSKNYIEVDKMINIECKLKQIVLYREANEKEGFIPGDIIINIKPKKNDKFQIINNYDILYQIVIANNNTKREFEYLDNKIYLLKLTNINFNKIYEIENKGLIAFDGNRGKLFIQPLMINDTINYSDNLSLNLFSG